jgi:hypothetical protein
MNSKFDIGGYELEIRDDGRLSFTGSVAGYSAGMVGLQLIRCDIPRNASEPDRPECVMQAFVKPSQARAIASALLSAATEARQ